MRANTDYSISLESECVKIRHAQPTDLDRLVDIFSSSFKDLFLRRYGRTFPANIVRDVLQLWMVAAGKGFLVAEVRGQLAGFIVGVERVSKLWRALLKFPYKIFHFIFTPRTFFITPHFIHHFFTTHLVCQAVDRVFQGRGIGRTLAEHAVNYLCQFGRDIYFETEADNIAIIKIYQQLGFERVQEFSTKQVRWLVMRRHNCNAPAKSGGTLVKLDCSQVRNPTNCHVASGSSEPSC